MNAYVQVSALGVPHVTKFNVKGVSVGGGSTLGTLCSVPLSVVDYWWCHCLKLARGRCSGCSSVRQYIFRAPRSKKWNFRTQFL